MREAKCTSRQASRVQDDVNGSGTHTCPLGAGGGSEEPRAELPCGVRPLSGGASPWRAPAHRTVAGTRGDAEV